MFTGRFILDFSGEVNDSQWRRGHRKNMPITLPLQKMSRVEKLRIMEDIWADLAEPEDKFESPGWHATALSETERLVKGGKAKFSDWQTAKERVRRKASK